ncbi:MAG: hypothetical protein UH678_04485 [Fibrobacteraceae bacterium]|nr:hypothetical protein [Fibrobacteraceae bacterium]
MTMETQAARYTDAYTGGASLWIRPKRFRAAMALLVTWQIH